ncbi:MAG: hypothetical protein O9322_03080 [Beijerinckiaceae bacterium]|nr:hypothetical protein [Beijerinckiaceae bacterium]MCZ8301548.1 hypothetical protein [Beijerinckiaceae bacterium]
MKRLMIAAGAALIASTAFLVSAPEASAWGCEARGNGTTRGWSTRYPTRAAAANRALRECIRRPGARRCVITYCDPYR